MTNDVIATAAEKADIQKKIEANQKELKERGIEGTALSGVAMLQDAVGADNHNLISHIAQKSASALSGKTGNLDVALESIRSQEPKDVVEARMISQANALYSQGMGMLAKMENAQRVDFLREFGNLALKLLRLHNETVEGLCRYRRGGEQRVTVVHMADKMAVVNNYGGGGSWPKVEDIPHA